MNWSLNEYTLHEYWLPWLSFWYIMVIIAPNYWKSNCVVFAISFGYFIRNIEGKFIDVNDRFKMSIFGVIVYFTIASSLMNSKLK